MFEEMQSFRLNDPVIDTNEMTVTYHFAAEVCDMADNAIRDAIVDAAQKAGTGWKGKRSMSLTGCLYRIHVRR